MAQDTIEVITTDSPTAQDLKTLGWVSYVLHLIVAIGAVIPGAQAGVLLLVIAVVLDLVKRDDAAGTWQVSHFDWRLRSVLFAGLLYIVTSPLWLLFFLPGYLAWMLVSIWFLYRIVRGMIAMNQNRPVTPMRF